MREAVRASAAAAALLAAPLLLACSGDPERGPGTIHWSRDVCERCQMVIGDRRNAVQLRPVSAGALHRFDDLGCALLWLEEAGSGPAPDEIWVRDAQGAGWQDGHRARFAGDQHTPMGYGFAPAPEGAAEVLGLEQVRREILAREDERRRGPS